MIVAILGFGVLVLKAALAGVIGWKLAEIFHFGGQHVRSGHSGDLSFQFAIIVICAVLYVLPSLRTFVTDKIVVPIWTAFARYQVKVNAKVQAKLDAEAK